MSDEAMDYELWKQEMKKGLRRTAYDVLGLELDASPT